MNEQQTSGLPDGVIACQDSSREKERADWKRRQAIQPSAGTWLTPTLPERINRLNPSERHQLSAMIRSMKLRKIVKRTLAEAFWQGEQRKAMNQLYDNAETTMQRLRERVKQHESLTSYERVSTSFEPVYTRTREQTLIIQQDEKRT